MSFSLSEELHCLFQLFDKNKDGYITLEGLRNCFSDYLNIHLYRRECKSMLSMADRDRDGKLNFHEFTDFYLRCMGIPLESLKMADKRMWTKHLEWLGNIETFETESKCETGKAMERTSEQGGEKMKPVEIEKVNKMEEDRVLREIQMEKRQSERLEDERLKRERDEHAEKERIRVLEEKKALDDLAENLELERKATEEELESINADKKIHEAQRLEREHERLEKEKLELEENQRQEEADRQRGFEEEDQRRRVEEENLRIQQEDRERENQQRQKQIEEEKVELARKKQEDEAREQLQRDEELRIAEADRINKEKQQEERNKKEAEAKALKEEEEKQLALKKMTPKPDPKKSLIMGAGWCCMIIGSEWTIKYYPVDSNEEAVMSDHYLLQVAAIADDDDECGGVMASLSPSQVKRDGYIFLFTPDESFTQNWYTVSLLLDHEVIDQSNNVLIASKSKVTSERDKLSKKMDQLIIKQSDSGAMGLETKLDGQIQKLKTKIAAYQETLNELKE